MEPVTITQLSLFQTISIISIPGFFGGIVAGIFDIVEINSLTNKPLKTFCNMGCKAIIGIAGAFGVIYLGFLLEKISLDSTTENMIFLISLSIVAGVISYQFLPTIGHKLLQQFDEKLQQTKETMQVETEEKIQVETGISREYSAAIAHAETALSRQSYQDTPQAIERLKQLKEITPRDRTVHILLGRLYKSKKEYDNAIVVLREYIDNIGQVANPSKQEIINTSDAHFNIACYHALKVQEARASHNELEENRLIKEALDELKISFSLWAENKKYAEKDPDFKLINDIDEFKELITT